VFVCLCRTRINLTAALFKEACSGLQNSPSIILAGLIVIVICLLFNVLFFCISTLIIRAAEGAANGTASSPVSDKFENAFYFVVFVIFWTNAFFIATIQMSVSGGISKHYYSKDPSNIGIGSSSIVSLGRAFTVSLGSLALGSLLIAIVQFLNYMLNRARTKAQQMHLKPIAWLLLCVQCLLGSVEGIISMIDRFAYIHIAMYGDSFLESCRQVFKVVGSNVFNAIMVDSIGQFVLFIGRLFGTMVAVLVSGVLTFNFAEHNADSLNGISPQLLISLVCIVVGVISYILLYLISVMISIGADTVLVCYLTDLASSGGQESPSNLSLDAELRELLAPYIKQHGFINNTASTNNKGSTV